MRRGLKVEDLGDLLDLPLVAVLGMHREDGTILLTPVWHEWRDGGFNVWVSPDGQGKVRLMEKEPRVSIVVAESGGDLRAIEVRGVARISRDGFADVVRRTARRYEGREAGDRMADNMTHEGYVIRIEPGTLRAWDYAA